MWKNARNGNYYYNILGLYGDTGKENGNYYSILQSLRVRSGEAFRIHSCEVLGLGLG